MDNTDPLHYAQLEAAVEMVITVLHRYQQLHDNGNIRIAVMGGLAVRRYLGPERITTDADVLVAGIDTANEIKDLVKNSTVIFCSDRAEIQVAVRGSTKSVDLVPEKVLRPFSNMPIGFVPSSAVPVKDAVTPGQLPYLSELDLLLSKIVSCGARWSEAKSSSDARDAENLVTHYLDRHGPITLTPIQEQVVEAGLPGLVQYSRFDMAWWRTTFGLP